MSGANPYQGIRTRFMSPEIPEDLEVFRQRLAQWDWHYAMSDDHRVWQAGEAASRALQAFLQSPRCTPAHRAIYDEAVARVKGK